MSVQILVLAAGKSRRFGTSDKLLAPFKGEPLIVGSIRQACSVEVEGCPIGVGVVTSSDSSQLETALAQTGLAPRVRLIPNQQSQEGIAASIRIGVATLPSTTRGVVIMLGDMPFVTASAIEALIAAFVAHGCDRAGHMIDAEGCQLNPVIWPARAFDDLANLSGDTGGKRLLATYDPFTITALDPRQGGDIDTPQDLARLDQM